MNTSTRIARPSAAKFERVPAEPRSIIAAQPSAIGYFAKISSTRLNAFSAATCGATSFFMISAQAVWMVLSIEQKDIGFSLKSSTRHPDQFC